MSDVKKQAKAVLAKSRDFAVACADTTKEKVEIMFKKAELKKQISLHQKAIEEQFCEIGRFTYDHFLNPDGPLDMSDLCVCIKANQEMIEQLKQQIEALEEMD